MGIQELSCRCAGRPVHRIQPYENDARTCSSPHAKLGFDSINVDLIYGLPYQNGTHILPTP